MLAKPGDSLSGDGTTDAQSSNGQGAGFREHQTTAYGDNPGTVFDDDPLFADCVRELVFGQAPRLFAVLQEVGHREDAWVAAWGLAFDDHVEVVDSDGSRRMTLRSAERARGILALEDDVTAHLFWLHPAPADD